jgi:hypothetical protein
VLIATLLINVVAAVRERKDEGEREDHQHQHDDDEVRQRDLDDTQCRKYACLDNGPPALITTSSCAVRGAWTFCYLPVGANRKAPGHPHL